MEIASTTFAGAIDVAQLAKTHHLISNATMSLADLVGNLLDCHLEKPSELRISTQWEDSNLSLQYQSYAAKEPFAGLALYNKIMAHPLPSPITQATPTGTQVQLLDQDGNCPAAIGILEHVAVNSMHNNI